ncbi:DUF5684 domain-containing protein [Flavobacterium sp. MFBS3-15]|uniref:DUF5684 domain-containing protein n=1 Tax=Flavobacterium sp. MFBS3-15 TaxID=2989816 RepID=UPI002236A981|nr:DUF5684 domain-containing protein [Flavobacterium sp. MFBS3-15]MCW4470361.1 DUF5684 domain-containing protein [Flavobacterium sp. MFBS3-15]
MENFGTGFFLFFGAIAILMIVSQWKIYEKAGKPGWAVLIPIYSTLVLLEIIKKPWWWLLMLLIPIVNIVFAIMMINGLSKAFGKDTGWTLGLLFLGVIFYPIMAFDKSIQYVYNKTNEMDSIGKE